ncbi:Subtilase family protein [Dysgonomonas macrotermitis]|uniref:Subtilase family protein n=2 Tax=Dysgonomonas macrotermitis TaxID=1346286 RepID=A0A1M5IGJ1_9BACT|nr:Subtilase family protein [Dysgonomonas macrotermitis]
MSHFSHFMFLAVYRIIYIFVYHNMKCHKMFKIASFYILLIFSLSSFAADGYMFRLQLKDKAHSNYSESKPEAFLSKRALERREKQGISIDSTDIPISERYIKEIESAGCKVVARSKWMNTVSVYCTDSLLSEILKDFRFVEKVSFVWKSDTTKTQDRSRKKIDLPQPKADNKYGYGYDQIKMLNGEALHEKGYKGKGLEIAIIDAGYENLKDILMLDNVFIRGIKDFVYDGIDIFKSSEHGLNVLSILATNRPNIYIGTAPEARYWLLRSEDGRSEYPIEEDYWVAAAEYADSVGVDLINTSLGYSKFDRFAESYTHDHIDGETTFISKAAKIATQKGMLVEVSAGNEGAKTWRTISVPADVDDVLTVGSVRRDSTLSSFSSVGLLSLPKIKPDVVALGDKINVIGGDGSITFNSGTSFSGPVICGMAACLWQAFPQLTSLQLLDIIRKSSDRYENPDNRYGYGIPDMQKAMVLAEEFTNSSNTTF